MFPETYKPTTMPKTTYKAHITEFINSRNLRIPAPTTFFAGSQAIGRISNGQSRPSCLWHGANRSLEDQIKLRTLSWVGWILGWHIDHIEPVAKGGSYNIRNLRLLPPSLNSMIGDRGGWTHDKLNRFVEHLGPEWRKELGIPENFKSCTIMEFFRRIDLSDFDVEE
jgi:hypothetical protein